MQSIKDYEAMAKLELSETEREWVSDRADVLLESFKELEKIDTESTQPLVTVLEIKNVLREDVAAKLLTRDEILANAPEQYGGYFQVPRTLD